MIRLFASTALLCLMMTACKKTPGTGQNNMTNPSLQVVFQDSTYQLTGVAISKDGRLFTSYPLWSTTYKNAVAEITHGNPEVPYPNTMMNSWAEGDSAMDKWVCVQAVYVDANNNLWVVDPASPFQRGVYLNSQKLVEISLATNTVIRTYPLAGATDDQSYINDVRVDASNNVAYLSNSSEGGIVVVDLNTGNARQVLQGNTSVIADQTYILTIDGKQINQADAPFYVNSDGIALTPDNSYLYYKPLSDHNLYRVPTADLRDTTLDPNVLGARVEQLGTYTTTDGMIFDQAGNLYMGDLEQHRIIKLDKNLKLTTVVQDSRLIWPDSYAISTDGYLYMSCSQINLGPDFNNGASKRTTPYTIYRIKLP
ncbi:MAG TPA: L-dopachrome tautomerase-related protein [Puia sp.]|nr:L-dopachrome tautomerase-related protein [Puia sp.]